MSRISGIKSLMSSIKGASGFGLNKPINPLTAYFGGQFVSPVIKGGRKDIQEMTGMVNPEEEMLEYQKQDTARNNRRYSALMKSRRISKSIAENSSILEQREPELYNQIMAGRRLPMDAVVLGGKPREDLLQEMASQMGSSQTQGMGGPMPPNSF